MARFCNGSVFPGVYRGNNGSVNIIVNFGWAGSAGRLILFPVELKAPNSGTFRQSKEAPRAMRFL